MLSESQKKTPLTPKKKGVGKRQFEPWKVLRVAGWKDNYYSSLLDWSYNNFLCIASGDAAYLYNMAIIEDDGTPNYVKYALGIKNQYLTSIRSSPNSTKLAVGYSNGFLKVYDYFYEKDLFKSQLHEGRIATVSWEDLLITGSKDQSLRIVDLRCDEN